MRANVFFEYLLDMLHTKWVFVTHVYDAYFDETGTHQQSPLVCVGGFLFNKPEALAFKKRWRRNVKPKLPRRAKVFHAVDCYHRQGDFSGISEKQRDSIFNAMKRLVITTARYGIIVQMEKSDYDLAINSNMQLQSLVGNVYTLCAIRCSEYVGAWLTRKRRKGGVFYVYEKSDYSGEVMNFLGQIYNIPSLKEKYHLYDHKDMEKVDAVLLQAADLLVWEWQRAILKPSMDKNNKRKLRKTLVKLFDMPIQIETFTSTATGIKAMVNALHGIQSNRTYRVR